MQLLETIAIIGAKTLRVLRIYPKIAKTNSTYRHHPPLYTNSKVPHKLIWSTCNNIRLFFYIQLRFIPTKVTVTSVSIP